MKFPYPTTTCVYLDRQIDLPIWGATLDFIFLFFIFISFSIFVILVDGVFRFLASDKNEIADGFNNCFFKIGTQTSNNVPTPNKSFHHTCPLLNYAVFLGTSIIT